jgi:hypothetical protein
MNWIGGVIVGVFLIGLILGNAFSRQREDAEAENSHADKLYYPATGDNETSMAALARAQIAAAKDRHSAYKDNTAYSKRAYRVSFWTLIGVYAYTVFTAAIVVFTVIQYGESHRFNKKQLRFFNDQVGIMRGQLEEMKTEQRAWLAIDSAVLTNFSYGGGPVTASVTFIFKNSGHLPAQNINVSIFGITYAGPPEEPINPLELRRGICAEARQNHRFFASGQTVFPGRESVPEKHTFDIVTNNPNVSAQNLDLIIPTVYGCVTYKADAGEIPGQTGFMYDILLQSPDGGLRSLRLKTGFDIRNLRMPPDTLFGGFDAE